jgi:circadian clock protein KaiC
MATVPSRAAERVSSGIPGLDEILGGGFPRNRLYLVHGNPGSGKTTLALQFLIEGARHGEQVLYVTLSETKEELLDVAASHDFSLEGVSVHDLALLENDLGAEAHYTLFHPSEVELGETTKAIFNEVESLRPTRVVFDSLSEMRLLARDPLRYRRQILALKQFFVGRACTVLLLDDNTSSDSDRQLESLAHGVIFLEQQFPNYGEPRRRLRILKLRGVNFVGGYHDLRILSGGITVFPRLVAADHEPAPQAEALSSGISELDALTGGGLDAGTAVLIMGPAGAGKSTVAAQYAAAAAARGLSIAYFTFDESRPTLLKRTLDLGMGLQDALTSGRCTIRQVDPAELSAGEFCSLVRRSVEVEDARIVVIDSLNGYQQSMVGDDSLALYMHELLGYLRLKGVLTIMVLAQSGMLGPAMTTPVDLSYLADTVLLLRFFESGGQIRKAISVVKKRTGAHEDTIREFAIGPVGVRVGQPLREFHGVLSGIPTYTGSQGKIMRSADE